jgi:hypothetical protein
VVEVVAHIVGFAGLCARDGGGIREELDERSRGKEREKVW